MSLKKVNAKHSTSKKKKIITIELKEIIKNHERSVCSGLGKPIRPKYIEDVHFFCFKNPIWNRLIIFQ